ncbi:hypothetical protein CMK12_13450 [Candidatus Poribacteria bacterium]|jgi:hypothetical protein|nr:hypothetical protein [Candidatus Poribacteria bacterium]MDP6596483.1 hypothetical protein [Candidatus Poribacteria bacterium]MDP6745489.1 hypothetical protein [Candidatus Poribacteria bacterium]MDP6995618.1 hypothetical protein [Candidatus Poribacteria bacterium]
MSEQFGHRLVLVGWRSYLVQFCLLLSWALLLTGCGEEGLWDPIDESKFKAPSSDGLHAPEFPTPTRGKWTYQNVDLPEESHQISIDDETRFDAGFTFRQMSSRYIDANNPGGELYLFSMEEEFDRILDELSGIVLPDFDEDKKEEELTKEQLGQLDIKLELEELIKGVFKRNQVKLPASLVIKKSDTPAVKQTAGDWLIQDIFSPYIIRRENNRLSVYTRKATSHLSANGYYFRQNGDFLPIGIPIYATFFSKSATKLEERAFDLFFGKALPPIMHQVHPTFRKLWVFPLKSGVEWTVFEKTKSPTVRIKRKVIQDQVQITVPAGNFTGGYLVEEIIEGKEEFSLITNPEQDDPERGQDPEEEKPKTAAKATKLLPAARYWVVPNVGIVKHQYFPKADQPVTYELKSYRL